MITHERRQTHGLFDGIAFCRVGLGPPECGKDGDSKPFDLAQGRPHLTDWIAAFAGMTKGQRVAASNAALS